MNIKFKDMQPGTKVVINEEGTTLAHVIKQDGEIIIDHIETANSADDTLFPTNENGKPLTTYKQAWVYLMEWFNN